MGATASVINTDGIPEDLKSLIDAIERQKQRIAEHDTAIMEKEMNKMFKGHNQIIDELTARTKSQIRKMLELCPQSSKYLDQLNEGGNQYAKFIKFLALPKEVIEIEQVKAASQEYDEELLVDIIGTSTVKELQAFDELLMSERSYTLIDLVSSQCKKDSPLFRFLDRILKCDRDESKHGDMELATKQAEIIHKAGTARLIGVEEEPVFEILSTASRMQCLLINEAYQENYKMKLERAINMKFKGNAGKLLVMWTQSIPQSIVTCLSYLSQKLLLDKFSVALLLAKYDKDVLSLADEACQHMYHKPLAEFLKKSLSGNMHRAVKNWIELPSPDKGFEKIVMLYLENKLTFEYSHATTIIKSTNNVLNMSSPNLTAPADGKDSENSPSEEKKSGDENGVAKCLSDDKDEKAPHISTVTSPSKMLLSMASMASTVSTGTATSTSTISVKLSQLKYPKTEMKIQWNVLIQDAELYQKFRFLLEKQGQEIKLFMIDKKIKLDASDSALLSRANTRNNSSMSLVNLSNNHGSSSNNVNGMLTSRSASSMSMSNMTNHANNASMSNMISPRTPSSPVKSSIRQVQSVDEIDENEDGDEIGSLKKIGGGGAQLGSRNSIFGTNVSKKKQKSMEDEDEIAAQRAREILSQKVYDFLLQYIEQYDREDEGSFAADDFWKIVRSLPGELLGFSEDDLNTIQQYCAWENADDGRIYYYEVLFEFAESVITAIENKSSGEKDVTVIVNQLTSSLLKSPDKKLDLASLNVDSPTKKVLQSSNAFRNLEGKEFQQASAKISRMTTVKFPKIPIYFKQYLVDTLIAFDFDMNGFLTRNELDSLSQSMNIPGLEADKFLGAGEESIEPKAASDVICGVIQAWFGDGEDHYICLVDKDSGAYFWYNTKDESTQWADTGAGDAVPAS